MGIANKPEAFYNCDESEFPVVKTKVEVYWFSWQENHSKTIQVTHGANREIQTVLAVCSGNGKALDSFIVI